MPQIVNTNIFSLNAQRNLTRTEGELSTALQRLSSGLRINSAKDDAAGIAIAARMTTQIGGLNTAVRNANDGISVSQTAEGAIGEMVTALNRMHDLAVQAANYNTDADRTSLNQEVSQLIDELGRIVNQTRFNGQKLLTGGFTADIQVGAQVNETINVSISNLSPTSLGVASHYQEVSGLTADPSDLSTFATRIATAYIEPTIAGATLNGQTIGDLTANSNSVDKIELINANTSAHGVTAFSLGNGLVGSDYAGGTNGDIIQGALVVNGITIGSVAQGAAIGDTATNLAAAINAKTGEHGVRAETVTVGAVTNITLVNTTGAAITVTANDSVDSTVAEFFAAGTTSVDAGANGAIILNQDLGQTTVTFGSAATGESIIGKTGATETIDDAPVNAQTVSTAAAANLAMLSFEKALDSVNSDRAILGAKLNRFESLIRNLENVVENITAARSRIQDADFAAETARLTQAQILQQAGVAIVAQANLIPQTALALLQ